MKSKPIRDAESPEGCQMMEAIQAFPAAAKSETGSLSPVLRLKLVLKRRLSVRAEKRLKAMIHPSFRFAFGRRKRTNDAALKREVPHRPSIESGDLVRVKTRAEIEATLDPWRALNGCSFLSEMAQYCGSTQKVLKRVERFIDERDYRLKKASGIVLLEGAICSGTRGTGRCDRSCFFFWREEWLELINRIDDPAS